MDMTPINFSESARAMPGAESPRGRPGPAGLALRWEAIHAAASAVAAFADLPPQSQCEAVHDFPQTLCNFGGWRRDLALQGVEDLAAILEPGLAALLAVHDNGTDAAPAAMALWQEFLVARDALLALAPPVYADQPA